MENDFEWRPIVQGYSWMLIRAGSVSIPDFIKAKARHQMQEGPVQGSLRATIIWGGSKTIALDYWFEWNDVPVTQVDWIINDRFHEQLKQAR